MKDGQNAPPWRRLFTAEFWLDPDRPAWIARLVRGVEERAERKATIQAGDRLTVHDFYMDDPRRQGDDRKFGDGWRDPEDPLCGHEVVWVPDTTELVIMRKPQLDVGVISLGGSDGYYPPGPIARSEFTVEILGQVAPDDVDAVMAGWEDALRTGATIDWVRDRLAARHCD